jgi:hypothetical protein
MREEKVTTQKMRARVAQAKPCVDTAPPKTMAMPHLTSRGKKVQLKEHREEEIIRDNQKLWDKICIILQAGNENDTESDSILCPSPITSMTCAPVSFAMLHRSKHGRIRRQADLKVVRENKALLARLEGARPFVDVLKMEEEYARRTAQRALHSRKSMRAKVQTQLEEEEEKEEGRKGMEKRMAVEKAIAMAR